MRKTILNKKETIMAQNVPGQQGVAPQIHWTSADAQGMQYAYYLNNQNRPVFIQGQPPRAVQPQVPAAPQPGQQNQNYIPQQGQVVPAGIPPQGQPQQVVQQVIPVQPVRRLNIWKWLIFIILFLLFAGMVMIGVITLGPRLVEGFKFAFLESDFSSVCTNSAVYAPGWNQYGKAFVANGESDPGFEYIYQTRRNGINVGNGKLVSTLPIGVEIQVWKVYEGCGAGQLPTIHSPP